MMNEISAIHERWMFFVMIRLAYYPNPIWFYNI
jgi:hypothetical protein